jgi:hypothetical protein
MSKTWGQGITPPPPLGDDENASIAKTSTGAIVEELMKQIEELNAKLTKLKTKKDKKNVSTSEDNDSSYEEDVSNKAKKDKKNVSLFSFMTGLNFNWFICVGFINLSLFWSSLTCTKLHMRTKSLDF